MTYKQAFLKLQAEIAATYNSTVGYDDDPENIDWKMYGKNRAAEKLHDTALCLQDQVEGAGNG